MQRIAIGIGIMLVALLGAWFGVHQTNVRAPEIPNTQPPPSQPTGATTLPLTTPSVSPAPSVASTTTAKTIPNKAYIKNVPFIEQAPHKNWDAIHEETCEEAAVLTVIHYLRGTKALPADQQEQELQNLIAWETKQLGVWEDTTVSQTAEILRTYYELGDRVRIIENASLKDLETELANGRPVIIPAAGRLMGNKYFKTPGPIYHMTVAIGFDTDEIITNDPGTRRGQDYRYDKTQLWNAVHDFVDRTDEGMAKGAKRLIVID